jgi:hypothetical protein
MVVFDVIVEGRLQLTIQPINQRRQDMYWFMVDQVQMLREKYGDDYRICRRIIH